MRQFWCCHKCRKPINNITGMHDADDTVITPPPNSGETPTGFQRQPGGGYRWQPPGVEHLRELLPQYEIHGLIGCGGMGAVYKGRHKSLDRTVAIKILPPEIDDDEGSFAERFKNEARAMARLNHPGIVAVHDFGETSEGQLYFSMEFVDGTDVARIIHEQGRMPPEHALAVSAHVCDALGFAHQRGVIHRDIKPANVLIDVDGAVKVADFGLAKLHDTSQTTGLTKTGMAMGSPDYVAPEAITPGMQTDARADIYSLGVMLYHMLTGDVPRGMFDMPSRRFPEIDPRFDAIIARAMKHDREERYQTTDELRRDLDALMTQTPVAASSAMAKRAAGSNSRSQPTQRPSRKTALVTWVVALIVLAAGGAFWLVQHQPWLGPKAVEKPGAKVEAKMKSILLPEVKLSRTSFEDAFKFLQRRSRELDTTEQDAAKKGINFILNGAWGFYTTKITAELRSVSLDDAVRYVADKADLKVSADDHGVSLTPKVQERLQKIIFPSVQFSSATLGEVITRLQEDSAKYDNTTTDPAKKGVRISLYSSEGTQDRKVTLNQKNISLGDILDQCAWQAIQVVELTDLGVVVTSLIESKLKRIILPVVELKDATAEQAIEQVRMMSRVADTSEDDPSRKGVNIILKVGEFPGNTRLNLDLKDVPLGEAVRYIAELSGLKMLVQPYAVLVVPLSE